MSCYISFTINYYSINFLTLYHKFFNGLQISFRMVGNWEFLSETHQRPSYFIFKRAEFTFFFVKSKPCAFRRMDPQPQDRSTSYKWPVALLPRLCNRWHAGRAKAYCSLTVYSTDCLFCSKTVFTCSSCLIVPREGFPSTQRRFATARVLQLNTAWHFNIDILPVNLV